MLHAMLICGGFLAGVFVGILIART